MIRNFVDSYFTYRLIKIIAQKWEYTPAFKAGIVDENGNMIVSNLTPDQKKYYGPFDRVAYNLKRVVSKVPGSLNPFIRMSSALALLKEEEMTDEMVDILIAEIEEDAPVNTSGGGAVAYPQVPLLKKPLKRKTLSEFINFSK
jgi:hypothetical protein